MTVIQFRGKFHAKMSMMILTRNNSSSIDEDDDEEIRAMTANEAKNLACSLKSKKLPGLTQSDKYQLIAMVNAIVEVRGNMSMY